MTTNRFSKLSKSVAVMLLAGVALSACGPTEARLEKEDAPGWAEASIKPFPLGAPFTLDGCTVQLYRVAVTPQPGTAMDVTMSTVNCPTAQVTSTTEPCGKGCVQNTVQVQPQAAVPPVTPVAPATPPAITQ